jgi:hypothetical protein
VPGCWTAYFNPRPPRELNDAISTGMQALILRALAKNPGARQHSASVLHMELEDLSGAIGIIASAHLASFQPAFTEIAHVLFVVLVKYSTLAIEEQQLRVHELHKIARSTKEYLRASSVRSSAGTSDWRRYGTGVFRRP